MSLVFRLLLILHHPPAPTASHHNTAPPGLWQPRRLLNWSAKASRQVSVCWTLIVFFWVGKTFTKKDRWHMGHIISWTVDVMNHCCVSSVRNSRRQPKCEMKLTLKGPNHSKLATIFKPTKTQIDGFSPLLWRCVVFFIFIYLFIYFKHLEVNLLMRWIL